MCARVCVLNQFPAPVVTPEIAVSNEEAPSTSQGLPLAPQLPTAEPQLDLEQQWQDIMAIMELQVRPSFYSSLSLNLEMHLLILLMSLLFD